MMISHLQSLRLRVAFCIAYSCFKIRIGGHDDGGFERTRHDAVLGHQTGAMILG